MGVDAGRQCQPKEFRLRLTLPQRMHGAAIVIHR
jgi:hypothetical protein